MGQGNIIGKPNLPATTSAKGVWNLREQNTANRAGTWPGYDPQWDKTTLLLKTALPVGDAFIDSSPNAFTVTKTGDVIQTTSTPYAPYWSNYFDGSGDSLNLASSAALNPAAGDFTFECWINPFNWTNATSALLVTLVNTGLWIGKNGSNFVVRTAYVADVLQHATLPTVGAWTHVVVVRSGTTLSLFYNGTRVATATNSTTFVQGPTYIGSDDGGSGSNFAGHISNLRFVKGAAVYNPVLTTLTVPTAPLTVIANTQLLTCQDNRFIDRSTNNLTLTRVGNVAVSRFAPFAWEWSAASGGSGYFDGSDSLSITSGTTTTLPSGNEAYTLEAWIYPTTNSGGIIGWGAYGSGGGVNAFRLVSNEAGVTNGLLNYWWGNDLYSSSNCITINQWQHVAATFDGTTRRLFVNGTLVGSNTPGARNLTTTNNLTIGTTNTSEFFTGHIANVRVLKGTAAYTANFTPPTSPVTAVSGTSVLLNFTNPAIYDTAVGQTVRQVGTTVARGTVAPSTNLTSTYFGGSGNYLTVADTPSLRMGTGNFTWEFWYYPTVFSGFYVTPIDKGYTSTGGLLFQSNGSDKMVIYASGSAVITSSTSFAVNTWYHLALVRNGTTLTLYVNGVSAGSATNTTDFNSTSQMVVGANSAGAATLGQYPITGFIANLRILNGTAAYTGTFTPSTVSHTQTANTALILNQTLDTWDATGRNALTNTGTVVATPSMFTGSALSLNGSQVARAYSGTLSTDFAFGTGDFTIEAWIYPTSSSGDRNIFSTRGDQSVSIYFGLYTNAMTLGLYTASTWVVVSSEAAPLNAWSHAALVRLNGVVYLYLNGRCVGSAANTTNLTGSSASIGYDVGYNAYGWVGQLDEVRVTKAARYNGTFTPVGPFDRDWEPPYNDTLVTSNVLQVKSIDLPGATNNVFRDDSTNNFLPVRYGDVTQGSFSPYIPSGYWSNYFDGNGDFLSRAGNSIVNFGSSNFTVEAWVNLAVMPTSDAWPTNWSSHMVVVECGSVNAGDGNAFIVGQTRLIFHSNDTPYLSANHNMVPGRWYHIALSRSGNTLSFFVNGNPIGTAAFSGSVGTGADTYIGCETSQGAWFNGHISNLRVVNGTALYTASFTPPTTPLTAVTNTSLLTCQDNRFKDNSNNNFALTRNGDVSVSRFDPFPLAVPVTTVATTNPGSVYFDGTGDYLTAAPGVSITGDFTLEGWAYFTGSNLSYPGVVSLSNGTFGPGILYGDGGYGNKLMFFIDGRTSANVWSCAYTQSSFVNTWVHLAFTRESGVCRLFVNGVQQNINNGVNPTTFPYTSFTNSTSLGTITEIKVGNNWLGNVQDVRVSTVARYTASFTPPTSPLTAPANTVLLTANNAGAITDSSANNYTVSRFGDAKANDFIAPITTKRATYTYGGSGYFDGTGDYLQVNGDSSLAMGTGDFTIETWINLAVTGGGLNIIDFRPTNTNGGYPDLYYNGTNIAYYVATGDVIVGTTAIQPNTWTHVALARQGTTTRLFVNGALNGSFTDTTNYLCGTNRPFIGGHGYLNNSSNSWNGFMANLRVVKGTAVYTAAFTPPTSPVTAISGTSLLLNFDNAGVYDATGQRNILTSGSASSTTTSRKYEIATQVVDGTTSSRLVPVPASPSSLAFGTGDFTVEMWINPTAIAGATRVFYDHRPLNTQGVYPTLYLYPAGTLAYYVSSGDRITGASLATGTWYHVALCRAASQTRLFLNGVQQGSTYADTNSYLDGGTGRPCVGTNGNSNDGNNFAGYIEGLRVSRVGRYTANFSVPSEPFPIA